MPPEEVRGFKRQLREQREALLLEREHWSLALRDPEHRERYVERQTELRCAVAAAIEAQMRELGKPDLAMPAEEVARILTSIIGGLTADELIEPKSIRPELFGEALALIHGGLVAQLGPQTGVADHRWRDSGKS